MGSVAGGGDEEEAEKKSILYPKGRTREIAEMEKMFDDKLGPHVRWIFNIQWETLGEMQDGYRTFGREKSESVRIKEILNFFLKLVPKFGYDTFCKKQKM